MFKKLFLTFILIVSVFALAGCGPKATEGTSYGLVHGYYVGVITVNVDVDGKVTAMDVEEYFLPYSWAKITAAQALDGETLRAGALAVVTSRGTNYYSQFIKIGDKVFEGFVTGSGTAQGISYRTTGISHLETWLKQEAAAKWYVEQVEAGNFAITTSTGATHPTWVKGAADASTAIGMTKTASGYWTVEAPRLGWVGNVAAFKADMIGQDLSQVFVYSRDAAAAAGSQFWTINGTVSGATWSDYPDYLHLAILAYRNAR
jgi:hypothetical protein